jgi:hypothetical protein
LGGLLSAELTNIKVNAPISDVQAAIAEEGDIID